MDSNKQGVQVPKVIQGIRTLVIPTDAASMSAGIEPTTLAEVEGIHLPAEVLRTAASVQRQFAPQLMGDPAFFGVGVTQSYDNPAEAALLVLVDLTKTPQSTPDLVGESAGTLHAHQSPACYALETRPRTASVALRGATGAAIRTCHGTLLRPYGPRA